MKGSFLTNLDSIIRNIDNNLAFLTVKEIDYTATQKKKNFLT